MLILIKIWNIARQTIFLIIGIIILETAQKQDFVQFLAFKQGLTVKACLNIKHICSEDIIYFLNKHNILLFNGIT